MARIGFVDFDKDRFVGSGFIINALPIALLTEKATPDKPLSKARVPEAISCLWTTWFIILSLAKFIDILAFANDFCFLHRVRIVGATLKNVLYRKAFLFRLNMR